MKFKNEFEHTHRRRDRPHSPHSQTPYLGLDPYNGVPIQCQFCSGQSFRRSTLRSDDIGQILLMRYPVRWLPAVGSMLLVRGGQVFGQTGQVRMPRRATASHRALRDATFSLRNRLRR